MLIVYHNVYSAVHACVGMEWARLHSHLCVCMPILYFRGNAAYETPTRAKPGKAPPRRERCSIRTSSRSPAKASLPTLPCYPPLLDPPFRMTCDNRAHTTQKQPIPLHQDRPTIESVTPRRWGVLPNENILIGI